MALPEEVREAIEEGKINLDDPATTLSLLQLNAVVGLTGFFNDSRDITSGLKALGVQCALCHSTPYDSLAPGIGHRLDGWANQDLNVGAIINLAPDLSAVDKLLGVDDATLRKVLTSWGPGKFDAEVFLDGKGFRPDGNTAATLIPNAFGLAGTTTTPGLAPGAPSRTGTHSWPTSRCTARRAPSSTRAWTIRSSR